MKKTTIIFFALSFIFAVDYEAEIQPIWNMNCGGCHTSNSQGGLNLLTYDNLMSSGTVVAGSALQSILYDRITRPNSATGDMPPGNSALSQGEIDLIAQWINEGALSEESSDISGCTDSDAITCDDNIDPLYFPECDTCSDDDPCDNYYNPDATIDNGLCMYDIHPDYEDFTIEDFNDGSLYLDWSMFMPPVDVSQYVLMRCADIDGDNDGDGEFEYEMCVMIIPPMPLYTEMYFTDDFSDATDYSLDDIAGIKYTLSIGYPNNNYWGSAFGNYYYNPPADDVLLGDLNFDGIINVIDVVSLVNGILIGNLTSEQTLVADLNGDQTINVIDIVSLVNMILG